MKKKKKLNKELRILLSPTFGKNDPNFHPKSTFIYGTISVAL